MEIDEEYGEIHMRNGVEIKFIKTNDEEIKCAEGNCWLLWDDEWVQLW